MREVIYALRSILKALGFVYTETRQGKNKYTMTIFSTPDDNKLRGTIGNAKMAVKREIRVTIYYEKTNNPDKEIEILEKQDRMIAEFYKYDNGNITFDRAEITRMGENYLNELQFTYHDMISL